jgi:hypothetical protein
MSPSDMVPMTSAENYVIIFQRLVPFTVLLSKFSGNTFKNSVINAIFPVLRRSFSAEPFTELPLAKYSVLRSYHRSTMCIIIHAAVVSAEDLNS